ncbi:hypothetical protein [Kitasatospora sp. A2-31]|uniref:hypothetical protein n=1 Tax=Kitasatospora sp. A2-31 TaxID=2916414 RepID=UPI001EEEF908|nr:hypothetical protein [Kitasatospora sp. A2-31]MCG6498805.1 hypothetical protein [Kitasatospora sp. A2-31]
MLVSLAVGVVTNLITDQWSWPLTAALGALTIAAVLIAVTGVGGSPGSRTRIRQRAGRGGSILRSPAHGRDGADIVQIAVQNGHITDSPVSASNADVDQRASRHGQIEGSRLDAE